MHGLFLARLYAVLNNSYLAILQKNLVILGGELCRVLCGRYLCRDGKREGGYEGA